MGRHLALLSTATSGMATQEGGSEWVDTSHHSTAGLSGIPSRWRL